MTKCVVTHSLSGNSASDADFRRLVSEYISLLDGCGLLHVPTAGEIDPLTVLRPTAGGVGGHHVRTFADDLTPIFLKFEFGSASGGVTRFQVFLTIGTEVDSSGNLSGIVSSRFAGSSPQLNSTPVNSYSCHVPGYAALVFRHLGSTSANEIGSGSFVVCRSCDANGYPTDEGIYVLMGDTSPTAQCLNLDPSIGRVNNSPSSAVTQFPLGVAQLIGGELPLQTIWMPLPRHVPVFGMTAFPQGSVPGMDQVGIPLVSLQERTYLIAPKLLNGSTQVIGYGILWE